VKPLPKPIEPTRKKRGGKRVRKMKERYAMTELRKQANRLNFAEVTNSYFDNKTNLLSGDSLEQIELKNIIRNKIQTFFYPT
jgi:U4/U6 small nuclear ribonucleoprotein PRP31